MSFVPMIPSPVAQWNEPPSSGAAAPLARLVPYRTPGGYWVFLPITTLAPVGYVRGAVTNAGGYVILNSSTTNGLRLTRAPSTAILTY